MKTIFIIIIVILVVIFLASAGLAIYLRRKMKSKKVMKIALVVTFASLFAIPIVLGVADMCNADACNSTLEHKKETSFYIVIGKTDYDMALMSLDGKRAPSQPPALDQVKPGDIINGWGEIIDKTILPKSCLEEYESILQPTDYPGPEPPQPKG